MMMNASSIHLDYQPVVDFLIIVLSVFNHPHGDINKSLGHTLGIRSFMQYAAHSDYAATPCPDVNAVSTIKNRRRPTTRASWSTTSLQCSVRAALL
jgi:hypothetical protein